MMRSRMVCTSAAVVLAACGGSSWAGPPPQELVGCYEVQPTEAGDPIPGFRLFLDDAEGAAADPLRASTLLPNGREGVYPFDQWSLSDGHLIVRSSGQSGAILTLSPDGGSLAGTVSYYTDVSGTELPEDVDVASRKVSCG